MIVRERGDEAQEADDRAMVRHLTQEGSSSMT
jgi:hypothetical protein